MLMVNTQPLSGRVTQLAHPFPLYYSFFFSLTRPLTYILFKQTLSPYNFTLSYIYTRFSPGFFFVFCIIPFFWCICFLSGLLRSPAFGMQCDPCRGRMRSWRMRSLIGCWSCIALVLLEDRLGSIWFSSLKAILLNHGVILLQMP